MTSSRLWLGLACALVAGAFAATEEPSLELFTGWSWWPYPYGRYPYPWGPYAGVGYPFSFDRYRDPYFYGTPYGYAPYWGPCWEWDYGVRYRVWPDRKKLHFPEGEIPFLPGAAPTDLRSSEEKTEWDRSIEAFLSTPAPAEVRNATNAPAAAPSVGSGHSPNT